MRREWSSWIRTRQWSEFEKLAKADPSQSLADTIAELELGFPEKTDKRALRKVLYLLSQAGFEPREIEEFAASLDVPIMPIEAAFMVSSDGLGDTVITYGREDRGRVGWLVAHLNYRRGVTRAVEDATTLDEANTKLIRLRNLTPTPFVSAEVPVEFALSRLAHAVSISRSLPPVVAYWRACLPKEPASAHPMDSYPRTEFTDQELLSFLGSEEALQPWRLELGSLAPLITELAEDGMGKATEDSDRPEKMNALIAAARKDLFTAEAVEDHRTRLLDLAYLYRIKGIASADKLVALADNLRECGPASHYADVITIRSMLLYIHTLRAANSRDNERVTDSGT
ncbi:MAG: hypothetical protein P4L46_10680 [Fimbriimonas sp.]|nr:hypothetical protein [Fimbriimonas sp.]